MHSAVCLVKPLPQFRIGSFISGLESLGYSVDSKPSKSPRPNDVLVIWNRSALNERIASQYERVGAKVLVSENGFLGRQWRGGYWYALARGHHNGAGTWPDGGPGRWDGWDLELAPWRSDGQDIVILAQRGIGAEGLREPPGWSAQTKRALQARTSRPVRIRLHPGRNPERPELAEDLRNAWACVTWASAAGLKALMLGVPVFHGCPSWIGRTAALPVSADLERPFSGDRLPMFRRLAWAMWNTDEIATGEPFRCLLKL